MDPASLVMGVVFTGVAAGTMAADISGTTFDPRWVLPAVLLGVGAAGLAGSLGRLRGPTDGALTDVDTGPDGGPASE
jgi:hypothetical protein